LIRQAIEQLPTYNGKLGAAVGVLNDVDHYRDLHVGFVICIFLGSAALSAYLSFHLIEIQIRLGIDKIDPMIPVFVAYFALFVIWVMLFLAVLSTLEAIGIRSIRSMAYARLSKLALSSVELKRLRNAVATGHWRHGRIFRSVVSSLFSE